MAPHPKGGCHGRGQQPHPAAYLAPDASRFHTDDICVVDGGRVVNSL